MPSCLCFAHPQDKCGDQLSLSTDHYLCTLSSFSAMVIVGSRSFTKSWLIWDVVLQCFCIFFPGECHSLGCAVQDAITFSKPNITGHTPIQPSLNKPEGGCPRKWKLFNNKCYLVHTERKDYKGWGTARESCKEKGGDLVSITNAAEQMFLLTQLEQVHIRSWIGLNDIDEEGNFVWSDGTPVTYTNWVAKKPFPSPQDLLYQSDCVAMMNIASIGSWRDEICDYKAGYVCQKATDPTIAVTNPPPATELVLFGKSLFWVDMISQPFADARKVCQGNGSEIASLISVYEQAFVSLLAQQAGGELWIGLKRNETNGAYNWLDGWYMHMTGWAKDQLDQSQACVSLVAGKGWMNVSCSKRLPVVCKKSVESPPTDPSLRGVCSSTGGHWQMTQQSCFTFHSSPKISWMGAAVTCSKLGGSLVSLRNKDESLILQREIKRFLGKTESFWIGLHLDDNGCLAWLDGSSTSYNRLWPLHKQGGSRDASTEGERCVTISSKDFSWKERSCTGRFGFICRKSGGKIRHNAGCEDRRTFIFHNPNITTLTPIQPSLNMPQGGCPWKWKLFNNKCYLPITQRADHKSWKHAQDSCKAEGGDLVSITNVDEQMFLLTQLEDFELKCWIGLNDINEEGNFVWSDGTPVNYTHWDYRRPFISQQYFSYESDCVVMLNYESIGSWRENRCDFKRGYICKMATGNINNYLQRMNKDVVESMTGNGGIQRRGDTCLSLK
uniref:C-type lectin domain-containing protein n=1 Tax=Eptatretus burgeri TaxID=7764 RepID=A0A8C4QFH3_EPTBU